MKDLSLDDLIKKDKEQNKQHKIKKPRANNVFNLCEIRKKLKGVSLSKGED